MSNPPLFCSIPLTNVVIDNLHLFLRVADRLVDLLIVELKHQDAIARRRTFTSFDREKYCHLTRYEKFVTSLGIPGFEFYIGQSSEQMKCRTLSGPEKLKVFGLIRIEELQPALPEDEVATIQHLWSELL